MSFGPCLCGDPYCQSCFPGNDGGALEAAEENLLEKLSAAKLSADEYDIVLAIGLAAVDASRKAVNEALRQRASDEAEAKWEAEASAKWRSRQ